MHTPSMPLLWCQFLGEIHKLFARKRTWIGFGVFLTVELLVLALLQLPKVQRTFRRWIEQAGYGFED